jgi:rod shape-determining protein MreC
MPLGTLDRSPPPFFKQGASALSKLMVFSAISVFLMVADGRFRLSQPLRTGLATAIMPLQWAVLQPIQIAGHVQKHFTSLDSALAKETATQKMLAQQALRSMQVDQLSLENDRLRKLIDMRDRVGTTAVAAQVLYDSADPYTKRVVIDRGIKHGIVPGSPVIDETGVLGQVTQVYPLLSEVTLLVDRKQAIPVLNIRTGVRGVVYGLNSATDEGMELRYTLSNADINVGDLLTTSGVDGVYPPGMAVARVSRVERRAESTFTRILCEPLASMGGTLHVLVLKPVATEPRPEAAALQQVQSAPRVQP